MKTNQFTFVNESCSLIPFTCLHLGGDKDTVPQENATLIAQAKHHYRLSIIYVHMSNNSGYTINIGANIRFFFKLHAENKTAQTISHPQQGEMLDPELLTYFSTNLSSEVFLEFLITHFKVINKFLSQWLYICIIDK